MKLKYLLTLTLCLFVGTFALIAKDDKVQPDSKYACETCDDDDCPSKGEPDSKGESDTDEC